MPLFRSKTLTNSFRIRKAVSRLEPEAIAVNNSNPIPGEYAPKIIQGIGSSGPCQTPDFTPATTFLQRGHSMKLKSKNVGPLSPAQCIKQHVFDHIDNKRKLQDTHVVLRREPGGFGFGLIGGAKEGTQIKIAHVTPEGPAQKCGQIFPDDILLAVNGISVLKSSHAFVLRLLDTFSRNEFGQRKCEFDCCFTVRGYRAHLNEHGDDSDDNSVNFTNTCSIKSVRKSQLNSSGGESIGKQTNSSSNSSSHDAPSPLKILIRMTVHLKRMPQEGFGFSVVMLLGRNRICKVGSIRSGEPADRCGNLFVGDRLLTIDGHSVTDLSHLDIVERINCRNRNLYLLIERQHLVSDGYPISDMFRYSIEDEERKDGNSITLSSRGYNFEEYHQERTRSRLMFEKIAEIDDTLEDRRMKDEIEVFMLRRRPSQEKRCNPTLVNLV